MPAVTSPGIALSRFIAASGAAMSHGEARRLVRGGRVCVDGVQATDEGAMVLAGACVTVEMPLVVGLVSK